MVHSPASDRRQEVSARVVHTDVRVDLALLKVRIIWSSVLHIVATLSAPHKLLSIDEVCIATVCRQEISQHLLS